MSDTSGKGRGKERIVREGGEGYLKAKETRYGLVYPPVEKIANILPKVKIEFGCLSMDEPVEEKTAHTIRHTMPDATIWPHRSKR